jgi:predicted component of type VI protein secretion system
MTTNNSILDELHAVREQMLADAGGTLAGLVAKLQADQAKSGRVVLKTADNHRMHRSGGLHVNSSGTSNDPAR